MGIQFVTKGVLTAPAGFWSMDARDYKEICNGAGAKGWGWTVPDTMWGLRITKAADIHDFMYFWGIWPRKVADKMFHDNMKAIIKAKGGWLKRPRLVRAGTYYRMVRWFGSGSYEN